LQRSARSLPSLLGDLSIFEPVLFGIWVNFTDSRFSLAVNRTLVLIILHSSRSSRIRFPGLKTQSLSEMLSPQGTQEPQIQLGPLVRIDTVRRVLFSGGALPMRALAEYSYV
jgi:hypothetical protein